MVMSVCVFSLHFRAQAWNFVKSIIMTQKIKFGSDPKILPLDVHFTDQTTGVIGQKKKIFSDFTFLYLIGKVIFYRQKFTKTWYLYFFVFQKLLRFINYWNQAVHIVFMSKKIQKLNVFVTQVTCFQNLAFKSYTSFDFINTYSRYRLKIIKLWWYIPPENYQITFETTETFTFQYRRIITF